MIPTIFTFDKQPALTLVGAGPGDPELITVKGINVLKKADIVLFDALVSEEILSLIPSGIPALCVGKRAGAHSYSQQEINQLIVELAYSYGHVVRLKGGDSFVFGRGGEEIEYAQAHGVETAIVPGITSAIAVPASLKIPLTARGVSESFWVVTATTSEGIISGDVALAAQSKATVVVLMGVNKIQEIMDQFAKYGRQNVPVAVIQNGTLPNQKSVTGNVSSIAALAKVEDIGSPAIIVIGEVVRYAQELNKVISTAKVMKNYQ
jgi:uroporphyrin-III C-methyltransferase